MKAFLYGNLERIMPPLRLMLNVFTVDLLTFFKRSLLILCMSFSFCWGKKITFVVAWQMATTKEIILDVFETHHMNLNFVHRCFTTRSVLQRNLGSREKKLSKLACAHAYVYIFIYKYVCYEALYFPQE